MEEGFDLIEEGFDPMVEGYDPMVGGLDCNDELCHMSLNLS
jgi:hypothetical protein